MNRNIGVIIILVGMILVVYGAIYYVSHTPYYQPASPVEPETEIDKEVDQT
jgi:hypothetical protein